MQSRVLVAVALFLSAGCLMCVAPAFSQSSQETGKLKVHVEPKQAYVFVDGKAIRDGSQTIKLAPGDHNVSVYNYGYESKTQSVHIDAHKTADLNIALTSSGDKVSGPFAEIEFKGDPRAAVLLNGKTPVYFVGRHVEALILAARSGHTEIVQALLDKGADVNAKTKIGSTALIGASMNGHLEAAKALLAKSADVNAAMNNGTTALIAATRGGHADIRDLLMKAGANP